MPQTDYEKVIDVFHSEIKNKYQLPDDLERQWFFMACADFGLDIHPLNFDDNSENFEVAAPVTLVTLGLMMARYYVKREQSRINKLNNIIGRDLQLNATGDSKKAIKNEYDGIVYEVEQKLHKLKRHAFN